MPKKQTSIKVKIENTWTLSHMFFPIQYFEGEILTKEEVEYRLVLMAMNSIMFFNLILSSSLSILPYIYQIKFQSNNIIDMMKNPNVKKITDIYDYNF